MIGHDVAAALPEMQAHAESLMVDTIHVQRQTGEAMDPDTLEMVPTYDTIYDGPGRIQRWSGAGTAGEPVVGGREFGLDTFFVQLPITVVGPRELDKVTVTAAALDPALVGLDGTVKSDRTKSHATKRVLLCEEVAHGTPS